MNSDLEIIYLDHSGFAVKIGQELLVFDYYRDPTGVLSELLKERQKVWVFSSHAHGDHFNPQIRTWKKNVSAYFLSGDILAAGGLNEVAEDQIIYMNPYETKEKSPLRVVTYGSTDEGVSFLVEVAGWRLFHAGDLNWWHWKEDTQENQQLAKDWFMKEMNYLTGLDFDVAFFPVDSRLEEYRDIGVTEFCHRVDIKQLVAMHTWGHQWTPPGEFAEKNKEMKIWCPASCGERLIVDSNREPK